VRVTFCWATIRTESNKTVPVLCHQGLSWCFASVLAGVFMASWTEPEFVLPVRIHVICTGNIHPPANREPIGCDPRR
jgi:hypothetical protein